MREFIIGDRHDIKGPCCAWCKGKFRGAFGLGHNDTPSNYPFISVCSDCAGVSKVKSASESIRVSEDDIKKLPPAVALSIKIGVEAIQKLIHDRCKEQAVNN